jgi:hypothetical protein
VPPAFAGFAFFGSLAILIIVLADDFRPLALRHQISLVLLREPACSPTGMLGLNVAFRKAERCLPCSTKPLFSYSASTLKSALPYLSDRSRYFGTAFRSPAATDTLSVSPAVRSTLLAYPFNTPPHVSWARSVLNSPPRRRFAAPGRLIVQHPLPGVPPGSLRPPSTPRSPLGLPPLRLTAHWRRRPKKLT